MADNDIYDSKGKYERFKSNLNKLSLPPEKRQIKGSKKAKYYCKNPGNLKYFQRLFDKFESKDLSYIRRLLVCRCLLIIVHATDKDLKDLDREDIDKIIAFQHTVNKSIKCKTDFIKVIKYIWKLFFPELDAKDRPDENLVPYVVRHLSSKIDKSREKLRRDKLTIEEYEKLIGFFSNDVRIQFFLAFSLESIGRPQEILQRRINDIEWHKDENYAVIKISDHGKEGTGNLQCIDSYQFLVKWIEQHPFKINDDAYIFINLGKKNFGKQLKPVNVLSHLKKACKALGINKPITNYSFKRNGVTFSRLSGDSDVEVQHKARWTSTRQLQTYDLSDQNDTLRIQLIKKGKITPDNDKDKIYLPKDKQCMACGHINIFTKITCDVCKRPLDSKKLIESEKKKEEEIQSLKSEMESLRRKLEVRKPFEDMMDKFFENEKVRVLFEESLQNKRTEPQNE